MIKKLAAVLLGTLTVFSLSSCGSTPTASSENNGKVKVSASFNAVAEFAKAVGKDRVVVSTIIPDGTEPHDFEPKASDLAKMSDADVFVYSGLGMESWAEKAAKASSNRKLVTVEAAKGCDAIQNTSSDKLKEREQYDPHIWISLKGAETETKNICNGLIQASPADKDYFTKNCETYVAELEKLYSEYQTKFRSASHKNFVTGHAAFAYLCRDFGLVQNSVQDVFAEGEPSAQKLTELMDYCRKNNVKTIFVEDMVSPEVSKTLAREVSAKTVKIYTMESAEDGKSYLERARDNLEKIGESLK